MNEIERLSALQTDASAALAGFRRRAAEEGLLDVAYAELDSPLGPLTAYVTPRGLVRLAYDRADVDLPEVSARVSPRVIEAPERTDEVRRELDEYFAGRRQHFDLAIDWALVRGFAGSVLEATSRIPFGSVSSYREVAAAAGSPNAYRAAGNALGSNPVPIVVPCHRVLHAGGGLGGYTGGLDRKRFLLHLEGVLPG
ncbi:MAG TPA: methylated-DNA--[protein]-cysteine S-methyltransferase [Candidatus Limnocylindria bacterium]|nr:methylated-DNA--[protein]-cysteine S-methyltransferase [Candidatus Limnocylindria bacterium]